MSLHHLYKWANKKQGWQAWGFPSSEHFKHNKRNYVETEILDIFRRDDVNNQKYHIVKQQYLTMFAKMIFLADKIERTMIALAIGNHWASVVKQAVPDAAFLWENIEKYKPQSPAELLEVVLNHCKEMVQVAYSLM